MDIRNALLCTFSLSPCIMLAHVSSDDTCTLGDTNLAWDMELAYLYLVAKKWLWSFLVVVVWQ